MKILVLNRGSSTIKCDLYELKSATQSQVAPLWTAHLQWKNSFDEASLEIKNHKGGSYSEKVKERTAGEALAKVINHLFQGKTAVLNSLEEIKIIGHRIVHGGKYFTKSIQINSDVKKKISLLSELAPLHNISELEGIEILEKMFGKAPQIAVFDTAFHHTLPKAASIYPGPYQWYEEDIKRYGFHGISYQYCSKKCAEVLKKDLKQLKMVICHLGSGASLCAIKEGKSIDTTMGFTPLDGLMMDTRPGCIDPGILLYLLEKKKKTPKEISKQLYEESGLLGLSGISSDMRDIITKSKKRNSRSAVALDVYLHRLNSLIGSMVASLNGLDVLVFTAGIGENSPLIRAKVSAAFSFLGIHLDPKKNQKKTKMDQIISSKSSKIKVVVVHTQEALEIARECFKKMRSK